MGRTLDSLLRRSFKTSKFKILLNLAISRLAVLKNQRQVRCSHARSDIAQLLDMGQQEQALLRAEHVIKEQNMFDAFVMMEGYCNVLIERVVLIENQKDCPNELKEAIPGLIFAASRCGEFPELEQLRDMFTSKFGKEFTASAVQLRNHCGVNPKMVQKMSTRQPNLESRLKVTKKIASEKGITLKIEELASGVTEEDVNMSQKSGNQARPNRSDVGRNAENSVNDRMEDDVYSTTEIDTGDQLSGSMKARKYADVASAAQAAFESAAHAAAAARAAVELSRLEYHDNGSDDQRSHGTRGRNRSEENRDDGSLRYRAGFGITTTEKVEGFTGGSGSENIHPIQHYSSESEDDGHPVESRTILSQEFEGEPKAKLERSASASSLDSTGVTLIETNTLLNEAGRTNPSGKAIHFDKSDEENDKDWARIPFKPSEFHLDGDSSLLKEVNKSPRTRNRLSKTRRAGYELEKNYADSDDELSGEDEGRKLHYPHRKQNLIRSQAGSVNMQHEGLNKMGSGLVNDGNPVAYSAKKHVQRPETKQKPDSVRTRRGFK